jgi:hypothetical protein
MDSTRVQALMESIRAAKADKSGSGQAAVQELMEARVQSMQPRTLDQIAKERKDQKLAAVKAYKKSYL